MEPLIGHNQPTRPECENFKVKDWPTRVQMTHSKIFAPRHFLAVDFINFHEPECRTSGLDGVISEKIIDVPPKLRFMS